VPGDRVTAGTTGVAVAGTATRRRPPRPAASARERARPPPTPLRGQSPVVPAAIGLAVLPVSAHAFPLGQRALGAVAGLGPALGVPEARP
jgi:hypothetical protein